MLSFKERLDLLENDLKRTPIGFISSKDLPFAIFRYDPRDPQEKEFRVREEAQRLAIRLKDEIGRKIHLISLAELYWYAIHHADIGESAVETLATFEQEYGFVKAEEQIHTFLSDSAYTPLSNLVLEDLRKRNLNPDRDIIFLMRAAVFAPSSYRVSSLLEQLVSRLEIPTVLFYPGTWRGTLNFLGLQEDNQPQGTYRVEIYGRDV